MSHHLLATIAQPAERIHMQVLHVFHSSLEPHQLPFVLSPLFLPPHFLLSLDTLLCFSFLFFLPWYHILIYLSFPVERRATLFLEEFQILK